MCYSAMVVQNAKSLALRYNARIQTDLFDELFTARLQGSGAKISRALEASFLEDPSTPAEQRIAKSIREFHLQEIKQAKADLIAQEKRLATAELSLLGKVTKKAQNDQRIASDKIAKLKSKIEILQSEKSTSTDSRIWPGSYAPLIIESKGKRMIQPFRYLFRPKGQPESFDRKFNGAYNSRRDRLQEVAWWKAVYGKQHGIVVVKAFYENVKQHDYENRALKKGEEEKNVIVQFELASHGELDVPCIWDFNTEDKFPLYSFALITDEPNPEVSAVGHDRTPIVLKPQLLDQWLEAGQPIENYEAVLSDKQPTYFTHTIE